uniref:GUN19 n=1 Tax=Arundo donax TaxID=35708 RepID=A0A0A9HT52_ARUDO
MWIWSAGTTTPATTSSSGCPWRSRRRCLRGASWTSASSCAASCRTPGPPCAGAPTTCSRRPRRRRRRSTSKWRTRTRTTGAGSDLRTWTRRAASTPSPRRGPAPTSPPRRPPRSPPPPSCSAAPTRPTRPGCSTPP